MEWADSRLATIARASAARFASKADATATTATINKTDMIPTPSTTHVNYNRVYEPAEDSYLLLDTLSLPAETEFLHSRFPPAATVSPLILEVGTGSGVVLAFMGAHSLHIFGRSDAVVMGTDVNDFACRATAATVELAFKENSESEEPTVGVFSDSINADLASSFRPGTVDVLVFNPPYVPTESLPTGSNPDEFADRADFASDEAFERDSHLLALSYAGGIDGMEVTNRLLAQLPEVLSERGVAYLLLCAQNRPEAVKERVRMWPGGWKAETVGSSGKTGGWEKLCVLRIWRA